MLMPCGYKGSQACGRASKRGAEVHDVPSLCKIVRLVAHRPIMLPHQSICIEVHGRLNGLNLH